MDCIMNMYQYLTMGKVLVVGLIKYIEKIIRGESTKASGATEVEFNYKPPAAYYYKTGENKYYKCIFKYRKGKRSAGGEIINRDKYYIDDGHEITVMEGGESSRSSNKRRYIY